MAGIAPRAVRVWMEKAANGDERYRAVAQAIDVAEAIGESRHIANISKPSGKEWTASAWMLERKYPDRFGKRAEQSNGPAITVNVGVITPDDVKVGIAVTSAATPSSVEAREGR